MDATIVINRTSDTRREVIVDGRYAGHINLTSTGWFTGISRDTKRYVGPVACAGALAAHVRRDRAPRVAVTLPDYSTKGGR